MIFNKYTYLEILFMVEKKMVIGQILKIYKKEWENYPKEELGEQVKDTEFEERVKFLGRKDIKKFSKEELVQYLIQNDEKTLMVKSIDELKAELKLMETC